MSLLKVKGKGMSNTSERQVEQLGTVLEIVGKDGMWYFTNVNNVRNPNVRLLITLEDKQGNKEILLTSDKLNEKMRAKEISLSDLAHSPVYLSEIQDKKTGEITERATIGIEQGEDLRNHAVKANDSKEKKEKEVITVASYERFVSV